MTVPAYRSSNRLDGTHVGRRVTVRRRLAEGGTSDTIGVLEAIDPLGIRVRRDNGDVVEIRVGDVVAARVIVGRNP